MEAQRGGDDLPTSALVGDAGASWRLKALKRAEEQAARDGRTVAEVVEERGGSLGQLVASAASHRAAPSRAHLHAIRSRQQLTTNQKYEEQQRPSTDGQHGQNPDRIYLKDNSNRHREMKAPKVHVSLSWGKRKTPELSTYDASIISRAASSLNKFANDGNFMNQFLDQASDLASSNAKLEQMVQPQIATSANSRYVAHHSNTQKKDADDADKELARTIMQNKQYSLSGRADDEYDFEGGPPRKKPCKKEKGKDWKSGNNSLRISSIMTQQQRCLFCFENPNTSKDSVLSIANFTYLMLPRTKPVVPGHCCILSLQHESCTMSLDDMVWEEIRNFKKCLIMMFAKQGKEVVFLETVMDLDKQRNHCLVECIPLPQDVAKQAPLYFKKAIVDAEKDSTQHAAKKLIDTSVKGLRGSIPKNFPYVHVEFGSKKGFAHVIDKEHKFERSLGLNVIRGMMHLPEEDMYRRRRLESVQRQKMAVTEFDRDWKPFDWTRQLGL